MPSFMHQATSMAFWSRGGGSCVWRWRAQNTSGGTSFLSNNKCSTRMDKWEKGVGEETQIGRIMQTNQRGGIGKGNKERRGRCEQKRDVLTKTSKTHCLGTVEPFWTPSLYEMWGGGDWE